MAQFRLNEADENFLQLPLGAALIFAGASGTETWIERDRDTVVRLAVKSVAVALANAATLQVAIEIGGDVARGQDGPAPSDTQLRASQGVQVLVKAGARLAFKAYPKADNAHVLRTVAWSEDLPSEPALEATRPATQLRPQEQPPAERTSH